MVSSDNALQMMGFLHGFSMVFPWLFHIELLVLQESTLW